MLTKTVSWEDAKHLSTQERPGLKSQAYRKGVTVNYRRKLLGSTHRTRKETGEGKLVSRALQGAGESPEFTDSYPKKTHRNSCLVS